MDVEKFELELAAQEKASREADYEHLAASLRSAGLDPLRVLGNSGLEAGFLLKGWATVSRLKAEGRFKRRPFHAPRFQQVCNTPPAERSEDHLLHLGLSLEIDLYHYQRDELWEPAALRLATETDDEQAWCRFFDGLNAPPPTEAPPSEKSGRNHTGSVDLTKTTLTEAEAASVMGRSRRWLSEKRLKREISARLYRQRCEGGKVVYPTKTLLLWIEEPGNELFNPGKRRERE